MEDFELDSASQWHKVLPTIINAIVSIESLHLRPFDTEDAGRYTASGFVVDKSRGVILSNRHVVNPSPTETCAVFQNYEKVDLQPLYYDPVHDFGFFRYDPSKIQFAEVEEIELFPQGAKVGTKIKICGNDADEKLSILGGTLSRLDRQAPHYGNNKYNDFNTFYYQAASGTSSGSSGSPVLDIRGRAIALNAGGKDDAASSFYFPLDRVVRALKLIQQGLPVPRGTLQVEFRHSSYDELQNLGLPTQVERECRLKSESKTGLLTVDKVLPEGPGYNSGLQEGDILLECFQETSGRRYIENFVSLWEVIDECVGKHVQLTLYRGKQRITIDVEIQDLHSITPTRFIDTGRSIIHDLSYQLARLYNLPCSGVYVADPRWFDRHENFLLIQMDGNPITSLTSFIDTLRSLYDNKPVRYRYLELGNSQPKSDIFNVDFHFGPIYLYTRQPFGCWERQILLATPPVAPETSTDVNRNDSWANHNLGCANGRLSGVGLLVSCHPFPIVVTSRDIVWESFCDVWISIGHRRVLAKVLYLGLFAALTFDAKLVPQSVGVPNSTSKEFKIGDNLELLALDEQYQLIQKRTKIRSISPIETCQCSSGPTWRVTNTEGIFVFDCEPYDMGGVLVNPSDNSPAALWMSVGTQRGDEYSQSMAGLNLDAYVYPLVKTLLQGEAPVSRCPGFEFWQINIATATDLGLSCSRAQEIHKAATRMGAMPRPLTVVRNLRPDREEKTKTFHIGDVLLEINGKCASRILDVESFRNLSTVEVMVLRNGKEIGFKIYPQQVEGQTISRILYWGGAVLHQTHNAVFEEVSQEAFKVLERHGVNITSMVYVASTTRGSPSDGKIQSAQWILEVGDIRIRSLDDLCGALRGPEIGQEEVRVKLLDLRGVTRIRSLKHCPTFWPTVLWEKQSSGWVRSEILPHI